MPEITPFLWFDTEAEEAANLYTSVFPVMEAMLQMKKIQIDDLERAAARV
jgi:predicted 3-demethylubiquinone-9 3-methyltransferase (glyoxalase superfamily)